VCVCVCLKIALAVGLSLNTTFMALIMHFKQRVVNIQQYTYTYICALIQTGKWIVSSGTISNSTGGPPSGGGGSSGGGSSNNNDSDDPKTLSKALPKMCNHLLVVADEVLINLETVIQPTNSTGFWMDYWVQLQPSNDPERILSEAECSAPSVQERVMPSSWQGCASWMGGTSIWTPYNVSGAGLKTSWKEFGGSRDNWGVAPGGKVVWVLRPPAGAKGITIFPPELLSFEKGFDFMKIYTCKNGDACTTQLYDNMTGTIPKFSSFCEIKQNNVDQIKIELSFDDSNNFESRLDRLCWEYSAIEHTPETDGYACVEQTFTDPAASPVFIPTAGSTKEERVTWIFSPPPGTFKSIGVNFSEAALPWYADMHVYISLTHSHRYACVYITHSLTHTDMHVYISLTHSHAHTVC
jgi:hypothetical protein